MDSLEYGVAFVEMYLERAVSHFFLEIVDFVIDIVKKKQGMFLVRIRAGTYRRALNTKK